MPTFAFEEEPVKALTARAGRHALVLVAWAAVVGVALTRRLARVAP